MIGQINYRKDRVSEIVGAGKYKDVKYLIVDRGWVPCAYVENIVNVEDYYDDLINDIDVHCGFSFCGKNLKEAEGLNLLGWDYGHCMDKCGYLDDIVGLKEWTYDEILDEVYWVIDSLKDITKNEV